MHIVVTVPAYGGSVKNGFFVSIWKVLTALIPKGIKFTLKLQDMAEIEKARNLLVARAFADVPDMTHILFVDTDMSFEASVVERLIAQDLPVCGCVYPKKDGSGDFVIWHDGSASVTVDRGIAEVGGIGMGLALIKREVFETLKGTVTAGKLDGHLVRGYFDTMRKPNGTPISEDLSFCKRWRDAGGKVHALVDADIGHIGNFTFRGRYIDSLNSKRSTKV